jgi:predicted Zn-dependent peptidase
MTTKKFVGTALACAITFLNVAAASALTLPKPLIPISQDFTLPNGLRVILSEDHTAPVASVVLVYNVGSRDEVKGRSGFAHLFEHMMFQGSENVAKAEHFKIVGDAGGSTNASTHHDFTDYYERVPSSEVKMALWLEADRMRSLAVTQKNFTNQLETVKEEKRLRIDNQPYGLANLRVDEVVFDNWANGHPVIGSFEDLEASSIDDVRQFFKTYYAPNNAVLAIVGDIDPVAVHKTVEQYFSDIPRQPAPPTPVVDEPPTTKARYELVKDKLADTPGFWMEWKVPPQRSAEYFPLLILNNIMSSGQSSRLYQRMVKGDQIALSADSGLDSRRGPSEWGVFVLFKPNTNAEKAREVVWDEIEKLKSTPVSEAELKKAQSQIMRNFFSSNSHSSLQKTLSKANMLARYAAFWGDPKLIDQDMEAVMKVTPADIQAVAKKYLTRDSVAVIDVVPDKATAQLPKAEGAH